SGCSVVEAIRKEKPRKPMRTVTLPVQGLNFATCAAIIEKRLSALEPVSAVDASYASQTVTITFDERRLSVETLRALVKDCGFACGHPMTPSHLLHAAAEAERAGVPVSLARATADDVATGEARTRAPSGPATVAEATQAPEHATHKHAAMAMDTGMDTRM